MLPSTPQLLLRPNKQTVAVAGYTGPADVAGYGSPYAYWGLRGMNAAYSTGSNPAIDVTDQAGANLLTVNILANGNLDTASINTWVTANSVTTIRVSKIYDQSGNARHVSTTVSSADAILTLSGVGFNTPVIFFNQGGSAPYLLSAANAATQAQPITVSAVARFNAYSGVGAGVFGGGAFAFDPLASFAAGQVSQQFGGTFISYTNVSDTQWAAMSSVANGASSSFRTENASNNPGVVTAGSNPGTNGLANTNKLTVGAITDAGNNPMNGYIFEIIIVPSAVSSGNQASLASNQRTYGGF